MNRVTFSLLFYIKRTKLTRHGKAPVYFRITINGQSAETSLKRNIDAKLWDKTRNCAKGFSIEATELNDYISSIRGQFISVLM